MLWIVVIYKNYYMRVQYCSYRILHFILSETSAVQEVDLWCIVNTDMYIAVSV